MVEARSRGIRGNVAEANESVLLSIQQPFADHDGGMVEFGPDGFLFLRDRLQKPVAVLVRSRDGAALRRGRWSKRSRGDRYRHAGRQVGLARLRGQSLHEPRSGAVQRQRLHPSHCRIRPHGGPCAITGGYVYRGGKSILPVGTYVYSDFCTGEILSLSNDVQSVLLDTAT